MEIVKADNLVKYYGSGDSLVKAVDHVGLSVRKGEFVAVVGTSGSGKTTLLNLLGGLDYADEGTVLVDGQDITRMKEEELTVFRRRNIGFVFQSYNLVTVLNVEKNITLPIRLDGNRVDEEYIGGITSALGISDKRKAFRISFQEDSSSGWPSQEPLRASLLSSLQMSLPETWIPERVRK